MIQLISQPTLRRRTWKRADGTEAEKWQLDFTITTNGVKRRYRHNATTRAKALEHYNKIAAEVAVNEYGVKKKGAERVTLQQLVDDFHRDGSTGKSERALVQDRLATKWFLEGLPDGIMADEVTARHVDQFLAKRERAKRSPATINRELTCLRAMFRTAMRWGLVELDPTAGAKKPRIPEGKVVFLEEHEQRDLVAAAARLDGQPGTLAPYLLPLVVLALHTGMRRGELLNLRWEQVQLERDQITITNTEDFRTKNRKSRVLGLTLDARRELLAWQAWFRQEIAAAREEATKRLSASRRAALEERLERLVAREPRPGRLVFPSWKGAACDPQPMDNIKHLWASLVREAFGEKGDDGKITVPRRLQIGIHALRHTFAVTLARQGVPLTKIKAAMGHGSIRTTEIYLRFYPDEGRDVAQKLPTLRPAVGTNAAQDKKGSEEKGQITAIDSAV